MVEDACVVGFRHELFVFGVPFLDDEVWWVVGWWVDLEPDSVPDGLGAGGAGED